ncbi:hypothetical protein CWI84_06195 [Idiomarina tyrosinivorans]|uniref:Filamentous haemagglutinin FhaB/tRNA nuclease CdiA-like TPS domain-containing protein n=1 Tax=Idiomarina tyrosinivorans TaxID=1445662 RepID=A0A432ZQP5_9GAMM|nr:filamentous hemagglutinin N-terminal domain-containing protein [Idiomarina tyrosinivorans]RUO80220.1 hypothetical protein CWI84_06195 [Idiomarina tyrosinivorans]
MFTCKWRAVTARILIAVFAGNPVLMAAHGIERAGSRAEENILTVEQRQAQAATTVQSQPMQLASGQQAVLRRSANGTLVIDIVTPTAKGVSHNKFSQFNVTPSGVILNNSQAPAQSVIGGWVDGNRRLTAGTAKLILAEVTSNSRSNLLGFTEVFGDSAEFVLANPNGITCDGCGFINTPRVMLTTGRPDMQDGNLVGIDVAGGDITITGAGLNASNVDKFDILTRAMQLNAALYARDLSIRTGPNYYDYQSLENQTSSSAVDDSKDYEFALDASQLGAMYANRISLIGTEAGLGVRSEGLITSTSDLTLTADGRLQLKDTIANGELQIASASSSTEITGTAYGNNVQITTDKQLTNQGVIAAENDLQISADSTVTSEQSVIQGNTVSLTANDVSNSGVINSNRLSVITNSLTNAGQIQAQNMLVNADTLRQKKGVIYQTSVDGGLQLNSTDIAVEEGYVVSNGSAQITAAETLDNKGVWFAAGNTEIAASDLNNQGVLQFGNNALLTTESVNNNSGQVIHNGAGALSVIANDSVTNVSGQIVANSNVGIATQNLDNGHGIVSVDGQLSILSDRLTNGEAGVITAGLLQVDTATLSNGENARLEGIYANLGADSFENLGTLLTVGTNGQSLQLTTDELTNRGVIESHGEWLMLSDLTLDNRYGQIIQQGTDGLALSVLGDLANNGGDIYSAGDLHINSANVDNTQGAIQAKQALKIATRQVINQKGQISSDADLDIHALSVRNTEGLIAAKNAQVTAAELINTGTLSATEQLALAVTDITNDALLYSDASLAIDTDTFTNTGTVAASDVAVTGFDLLENSGRIESDRGNYQGQQLLNTDTGVLVNADTGAETLVLDVAQLTNQGVLHNSSDSMSLGGDLRNSGQLIHAGSGQLLLGNQGTIDNSGGRIASAGDVRIENSVNGAGSVYAKQSMTLARSNGTLVNNSELYTEGTMQVSSALNNQGGSLLSDGTLTIDTQGDVTNSGQIQGQALQLQANTLNNDNGVLTSTGSAATLIDTAQLSNRDGVIQATNDRMTLRTRSGELDNQQGLIQSIGVLALETD